MLEVVRVGPLGLTWMLVGNGLCEDREHPGVTPRVNSGPFWSKLLMRHEPPSPFWPFPRRSRNSWGPTSLGWRMGSHQGGCSALPVPTLLPACKHSSPGKLRDGTSVLVGEGQLRQGPKPQLWWECFFFFF